MIRFFKDAELTRPVQAGSPLWVLSPEAGCKRRFSLWIGDTYATTVMAAAAQGADRLSLIDTSQLPESGRLSINGAFVTYAGKTANSVTGIPANGEGSIAEGIAAGALAYPELTYTGSSSLSVSVISAAKVRISVKRADQLLFGVPGAPAMFVQQEFKTAEASGPVAFAQVDVQVEVPAGPVELLPLCHLETSAFTLVETNTLELAARVPLQISRKDYSLPQSFRVLPANRRLAPQSPAFRFGEYRWRDESNINATVLTPTMWDLDTAEIGSEKFIAGVGDADDLKLLAVEKSTSVDTPHSLFARIRSGHYFTGPHGYFCPDDGIGFEVVPVWFPGQEFTLTGDTRPQTPLFIGCFKLDHEGYYDLHIRYEYMATGFEAEGPEYQFTLNRRTNVVQLNKSFALERMFVGQVPDTPSATFDIPVFPVSLIHAVRLGADADHPEQGIADWTYNDATGELHIGFPEGTEGRAIYVDAKPAVAVIYEQKATSDIRDTRLVTSADLNPAFAGIAEGYLYLEHRRRRPRLLELFADKPRIVVPASYAEVAGLVAFGPVFYEHDFALLMVTASGANTQDPIQAARLKVSVDRDFQGMINYRDPSSETVEIVTGGDGKAALLYTPPEAYGYYTPVESVSGTDLTLPEAVPLNQLWNVDDGWLVKLYTVANDDPFFGKVGADAVLGEVLWQTSGVAGEASYCTNGRRDGWKSQGAWVYPVAALDEAGTLSTDPGFSGSVKKLRYEENIPVAANYGAYFATFVGRMTIKIVAEDSGIESNPILLQLEPPPEVVDESGVAGYLRLEVDDIEGKPQGRLEVNRLGGAPILPINVNRTRY